MRIKTLLICALTCWGSPAAADPCRDIYNAIKMQAMYCGFFCDQARLAPLQQEYEANCIVSFIPAAMLMDIAFGGNAPGEALGPFAGKPALPGDAGLASVE
jgi:hypothetical protein